jgi:hypothetical protein
MPAPRCLGSAAMAVMVSAEDREAMSAIAAGSVNTTWKYATGSSSAYHRPASSARKQPAFLQRGVVLSKSRRRVFTIGATGRASRVTA